MLEDCIIEATSIICHISMLQVIYYTFLFPFFFPSSSARKNGYKVQPSQELVALDMIPLHVVRIMCILGYAIIVHGIGIDGCLGK